MTESGIGFRIMASMTDSDRNRWVEVTGLEALGVPYPVRIRVDKADDGRLICIGLRVAAGVEADETAPDQEVTARSLRAIPLSRVLVELAAKWDSVPGLRALLADWGTFRPYQRPPVRPGPKGYPEEHYRRIAEQYRRALLEHPRGTFLALAAELHASEATVRRWVQRAQDKGYLGESTPGKAGRKATP
jgi:hypothetical protein